MANLAPACRRRVLSDQSTNAYIQSRGQDKNNSDNDNDNLDTKMSSQLKPWSFRRLQKIDVVTFQEGDTPPKIGQKRSIDLVDGTEEYEHAFVKQGMPPILMRNDGVVACATDEEEDDSEMDSKCKSEGEIDCALKMEDSGETKSDSECKMKETTKKEEDAQTKPEREIKCAVKEEEDGESESEFEPKGTLTKEENGKTKSECESESEDAPKKEDDSDAKATTNILSASFHASQEGSPPLEEQFDIQEEASQQTLESLVSIKLGALFEAYSVIANMGLECDTTSAEHISATDAHGSQNVDRRLTGQYGNVKIC